VVDLKQKDVIDDRAGDFYTASRGFSLSPDGRLAAFWKVVNYQDVLGLFTLSPDKPLFTLDKLNGAEQATAFSPDGRYVVRANGNKVEFWNIQTRQMERDKTLTGKRAPLGSLAFSADGQLLVSASGDVWNVATGKTVVNVSSKATQMVLSPNGQVLAGNDGSLWNATTGQLLGHLSGTLGPASHLAFTPDGRSLIVQTSEGVVEVWGAKP
jgi:WD40 repeat protein